MRENNVYYHDLNIPPDPYGYDLLYMTPEEALHLKAGDEIAIGFQSVAKATVERAYAVVRVKRGDLIKRDRGYFEIHDQEHLDYVIGCIFCEKRSGEV